MLATILVGTVPALEASRPHPQGTLRDGRQGDALGVRGRRLRSALVVSEVALALLLLCGAGLMLRSFLYLNRVSPGFLTEHLLTMKIALPLGLAAVGIYGVLAFGVSRRSREIGIRLTLGARPRDVLRLVVRQGMQLVIAGVLLGIAGELALTRLMASLLYGVRPTDPATFAVV